MDGPYCVNVDGYVLIGTGAKGSTCASHRTVDLHALPLSVWFICRNSFSLLALDSESLGRVR